MDCKSEHFLVGQYSLVARWTPEEGKEPAFKQLMSLVQAE